MQANKIVISQNLYHSQFLCLLISSVFWTESAIENPKFKNGQDSYIFIYNIHIQQGNYVLKIRFLINCSQYMYAPYFLCKQHKWHQTGN
jgi:hypothetical protein